MDSNLNLTLDIIYSRLNSYQKFDLLVEIRSCQPLASSFSFSDRIHLEWAVALHALREAVPRGDKDIMDIWNLGIIKSMSKFPVSASTAPKALIGRHIGI